MDTLTKSPAEKFPVYFNFLSEMVAGETVTVKTITCKNAATGVDSKTTIIDSEAIVSPDVKIVVKAGTENDEHLIECIIETSFGSIFQRDLLLRIQSVVDESFTKQPDDTLLFEVDFTRRLESGDPVSSGAATVIKESDGSDVTGTINPSLGVASPYVRIAVAAGVSGQTYRFGVRGTTNAGYVHEKFIRMNVQEYGA